MLEEYYKYKTNYSEYIIIIKSGNFYEAIDKDALIVNKLFKYKITKLSDTIKCGFPITCIEKVIKVLNEHNINYIVVEKNDITINKSFEENSYNEFEFDINNIKYNFFRINKISKYLNDNAFNNINTLLDEMERLINERG